MAERKGSHASNAWSLYLQAWVYERQLLELWPVAQADSPNCPLDMHVQRLCWFQVVVNHETLRRLPRSMPLAGSGKAAQRNCRGLAMGAETF